MRELARNAKSIAEIEKLEKMLNEGKVPGMVLGADEMDQS